MRNKIVAIISGCLTGITVIGLIIGFVFVLNNQYNKGNVNQGYNIVVADEVTIYSDETYALVPYLVRQDGTIEESRFQYTPSSSDISVTDDGVISVSSVPEDDVYVSIYERNTATTAEVNVNIVGKLTKVLGISQ